MNCAILIIFKANVAIMKERSPYRLFTKPVRWGKGEGLYHSMVEHMLFLRDPIFGYIAFLVKNKSSATR